MVELALHEPIKDDNAHPVATSWRPTIREIVRAFVKKDYGLSRGIDDTVPVVDSAVEQITSYIRDYGETLVELPEDSWSTSISQWMGSHWEVMVDLWTAESGWSDMVLNMQISEKGEGFEFEIISVFVP